MIREKFCYAVVFLSEALTVWLYWDYIFARKKSNQTLAGSLAVCYGILYALSSLGNTTLNAAACCIANFILTEFNYQCSKKSALLHTAFLCFAMAGSEILVLLLFNIFGYEFSAHTHNFNILFSQVLLSKLLYLVVAMVGSRIVAPQKTQSEEPHFVLFFCSLPILSAFLAIFIVYLGMTTGFTEQNGLMMLITILTLLGTNLIFLALYNFMIRASENYLTLQLSIQKEQADIAYYKALQEQFENQRILVHDIKKHLEIIDALAKQENSSKIESYVAELNASLVPAKHAKLCTDSILNLLLLRFRDECKEANVDFQCDVRDNVSAFMDASSVTTLYGNLLSNALEAAALSAEKQIELSVTRNILQSVIVISVINSCDVAPVPDGHGSFHTHKADHICHGVGLRSIDRIVKKYHGVSTMYFAPEKKQFHHIIQFPVPSE